MKKIVKKIIHFRGLLLCFNLLDLYHQNWQNHRNYLPIWEMDFQHICNILCTETRKCFHLQPKLHYEVYCFSPMVSLIHSWITAENVSLIFLTLQQDSWSKTVFISLIKCFWVVVLKFYNKNNILNDIIVQYKKKINARIHYNLHSCQDNKNDYIWS